MVKILKISNNLHAKIKALSFVLNDKIENVVDTLISEGLETKINNLSEKQKQIYQIKLTTEMRNNVDNKE